MRKKFYHYKIKGVPVYTYIRTNGEVVFTARPKQTGSQPFRFSTAASLRKHIKRINAAWLFGKK